MQETFRTGGDVHVTTAAQVFGVAAGAVTKEQRQRAKAINFGIIYGMSEYGLARQLKVPLSAAREYIQEYQGQYPGIQRYIRETVAYCRKRGYVWTVFGRRCFIPGIWSAHGGRRHEAERTAINAPIQGTAADLTKLAMVAVHGELQQRGLRTRILMQIHDELVFEAPCEEAEGPELLELVRSGMEHCAGEANLSVPLTVDTSVRRHWADPGILLGGPGGGGGGGGAGAGQE